jgi:structural maintenance of chromosome 2
VGDCTDNRVVDTAETGMQLLQNGKLQKCIMLTPFNKISTFKPSAEKIGAAKKIVSKKSMLYY